MNTQPAEMRDRLQRRKQLTQTPVGNTEWIAATEYDLADVGLPGQPVQGDEEAIAGRHVLVIGEVTAEAVTAMHRTGTGHHQQHPALIFMQDPRHRSVLRLLQRIRPVARHLLQLLGPAQHLMQQRIERIARANPPGIAAWHLERKVAGSGQRRRQTGRIQLQQPQQLGRIGDDIGSTAIPVAGRQRLRYDCALFQGIRPCNR